MNRQTNDDENRTQESWLSSLARIYGSWHLGITAMQSAAWTVFVYWNASGEYDAWADAIEMAGEKSWPAIPAFFITSAIILAAIQKGGRMVLTFMDERRKRIEKAREEVREEMRAKMREEIEKALAKGRAEMREKSEKARAEGIAEGRAEGRAEMREETNAAWSDWNRRRVEAEMRGERFDEPPPSVNGR